MRGALHRAIRRVVATLTLLLAAGTPTLIAGTAGDPAEMERLNRSLKLQLELAGGEAFYLRVDAEGQRLDLMLQGVLLQSYTIRSLEIGWPRVALLRRTVDAGWAERAWSGGRLSPARPDERIEIRANDGDSSPPEPPVPRPPEEICPAPGRFVVHYEGGLSLEIVGEEEDGEGRPADSILSRLADAARAAWLFGDIAPRVRITLPAGELASLYRGLPPETSLLLLLDRAE
jgi:hypothetical protein